jgi:hypothetical protein
MAASPSPGKSVRRRSLTGYGAPVAAAAKVPPDVRELVRPRRLVTRELYPFNAFYGHADLLRTYAGITRSRPLKLAIEHGPTIFPNPHDPDLVTRLPRYFCAAPARAQFFEEHALHHAPAVPVGPLVLYAHALAPSEIPSVRRLVFFDAHSSDYLTASYDVGAAVARLEELRDEFEEVVVCLYWRDILLGRAELYRRHGFRCVTAGHIFDPRFLFRLAEIISSASVVLTDSVGSHLLYALALDRPVWLEHSPTEYNVAGDAPHGTVGPPGEGELIERAARLFSRRVERVEGDQRAFADELCGLDSLRSPAELANLIGEAEEAYRSQTPARWRLRLEATATARYLWNTARW